MKIFKKFSHLLFFRLSLVVIGIIALGSAYLYAAHTMPKKEVLAVVGTLNIPNSQSVTTTTMNVTNITLGGVPVTATGTNLNALIGIQSNVQGQLDLKAPKADPTFTGDMTMPGGGIWKSDGTVGIGTTAPGYSLHVKNSGNTLAKLETTAASNSQLRFADSGAERWAIGSDIDGAGANGKFQLWALAGATGAKMTVQNDGNVGIGTTDPSTYKLYVANGTGSNVATTFDVGYAGATGNFGAIDIFRSGSSAVGDGISYLFSALDSGSARQEYAGISGQIEDNTAGAEKGRIAFLTTDSGAARTEKMRITSTGNVGIGTTSPSYKLDIDNGATAAYPLELTSSSKFVRIGALNASYAHMDTDATNGFYMYDPLYVGAANSYFGLSTGNSYIAGSGGYVGIGTQSPTQALTVGSPGSAGGAFYNIGASTMGVGSSLYSYGYICAGNSSGACTGSGGVVLNANGTIFANSTIQTYGDLLANGNYGLGLVGVYSAVRYQNVFAMGAAYRLAADGTTPGNLYGIAWTHSNVGGQSIAGLSHQALFMTNGVTQTAIGTGIWTLGNVTAGGRIAFNGSPFSSAAGSYGVGNGMAYNNLNSIAVDTLETDSGVGGGGVLELIYYGGSSVQIGPGGNKPLYAKDIYNAGWFRNQNSLEGLYNTVNGNHFYSESANYWTVTSAGSTTGGLIFRDQHQSTLRGYVYHDASGFGLLSNLGSWVLQNPPGTNYANFPTSIRSPIFYDYDNTGYYVDPHATSVLNSICAGGSCADYLTNDGSYLKTVGDFRVSATFYNDGNAYSTSFRTTTSTTWIRMIYNGIHTIQNGTNYDLEIQSASHGAPSGRVQVGSGGAWSPYLYVYGPVYGTQFIPNSDIRLKENIHTVTKALDTIKALHSVTFRWKDNGFDLNNASNQYMNPNSIGFIAQEVESILPQVVQTSKNGYKGVNYDAIVPITVAAIQEQQAQIVSLQSITAEFMADFKAGLIETKKLVVDGVDILKKINELSDKADTQEKTINAQMKLIEAQQKAGGEQKKEIEELKKSLEELKKHNDVTVVPGF